MSSDSSNTNSGILTLIGGILAFALGMAILAGGVYAWKYFMAAPAGKANAEWQIESAPSRIQNYNHFFNLCSAIQGYEAAIAAQRSVIDQVQGKEAERTRANINGLVAQRARAIAQYNADVHKEYTMARFLDPRLPINLNVASEKTQCAN